MARPGSITTDRRRLGILAVLVATLAQVALPAAHSVEVDATLRDAQLAAIGAATASEATGAGWHALSHDPTRCPVCESLLRAKPALGVAAPSEHRLDTSAPLLLAPPLRAGHDVARGRQRPRAPPASSLVS